MPHSGCAASFTEDWALHRTSDQISIRDTGEVRHPGSMKVCLTLWKRREGGTTLWNQEIIYLVDTLDGRAAVEQNNTDLSFQHDRKLHYPPPTLSSLEVFPFFALSSLSGSILLCQELLLFFSLGKNVAIRNYSFATT